MQGSSLNKFKTASEAVHYCYQNIQASKAQKRILMGLRTGICRIIRDKMINKADPYLYSNLNLNICVDGKTTFCQIGNGGILIVINIVGKFETADEAINYCYENIQTSEEQKLILKNLRCGIYKIIRRKMISNLNLNICVDGKITICQIGDGGFLLAINIFGKSMEYKWNDLSAINEEFCPIDIEKFRKIFCLFRERTK